MLEGMNYVILSHKLKQMFHHPLNDVESHFEIQGYFKSGRLTQPLHVHDPYGYPSDVYLLSNHFTSLYVWDGP